jgi:hypothetical protein
MRAAEPDGELMEAGLDMKREGSEINISQVIIHLIHSVFATTDMMKPASLIMAVLCKECIKPFVEGLPWTFILWPV